MTGAIGPTGWPVPDESPWGRGVSAQTGQRMARKEMFFTKVRYSILYGRDVRGFYF